MGPAEFRSLSPVQQAALTETIRQLHHSSGQPLQSFVDEIKCTLTEIINNSAAGIVISTETADWIEEKLQPKSRALYNALDRITKNQGVSGKNLLIVNFYVNSCEDKLELYNEVLESLKLAEEYPEVFSMQSQFGGHVKGTQEFADVLRGAYVLYRPYYLDTENEIMRCSLRLGEAQNPFSASIHYKYDGRKHHRMISDYMLEGTVVPIPNMKRAFINVSQSNSSVFSEGNQLLIAHKIEVSNDSAMILHGTAVSALGDNDSNAWPFVAVRGDHNADFVSDVVSYDHDSISTMIKNRMSMGKVLWSHDYL